jgi:hypothetical protein
MGRNKKNQFVKAKMLAARVEEENAFKLDLALGQSRTTLQEAINAFCVGYISGTLVMSGTQLVGKK